MPNPTHLALRAAVAIACTLAVMGGALFLSAGTIGYAEGWILLAVYAAAIGAETRDLFRRNRALLERRLRAGPSAETRRTQKFVMAAFGPTFLALFVVSGIDHRQGWSDVPECWVLLGILLVLAGFGVVAWVLRTNPYSAAVIEVEREQTLVSTGPYAIVRHPMYTGGIALLLGTPLALGSYRAMAVVPLLVALLVWRLLDEEELLTSRLAGYDAYRREVRWRLFPGVW